MLSNKISRRDMLKVLGVAAVGTALAACAPKAPTAAPTVAPKKEEPTKVPEAPTKAPEAKKIKLLLDGGNATPTDPKAKVEEGQTPKKAGQTIADAYIAEHPNVEIEWYYFPPGTGRVEWLQARMTAQDCPETFWMNTEDMWPHTAKGWFLIFDEYLDMPNPYVSGNKSWRDQYLKAALISQIGPDGKSYGVNMDGAAVLQIYNKNAFAEAGITTLPKTWREHMEAWQKLKDKGYIPYGGDLVVDNCCFAHWTDCLIYTQLCYDKVGLIDDDKNWVWTSQELCKHSQKGEFPFWDEWMVLAHLFREQAPYLPLGYEGKVDYRQLFRQGKVAMYMEGNWQLAAYKQDPPPFEISWFDYPMITKDIWPGVPEKTCRICGAWGGMQYHVPGYLTKTDPEKLRVVMDWLMFLSKPENVTLNLQENTTIPLVREAKGQPGLEPFLEPYDFDIVWAAWNNLSYSAREQEHKLYQAYVPTQMSDAEFLELCKKTWDEELKKVLETNPEWKIG